MAHFSPQPQAANFTSHNEFYEEFGSWINTFAAKVTHTHRAHMYLQSLDPRTRRAMKKCTPGDSLFTAFKFKPNYDDGTHPGAATVDPLGDDVIADAVTWQMLHHMNVERLRSCGTPPTA